MPIGRQKSNSTRRTSSMTTAGPALQMSVNNNAGQGIQKSPSRTRDSSSTTSTGFRAGCGAGCK